MNHAPQVNTVIPAMLRRPPHEGNGHDSFPTGETSGASPQVQQSGSTSFSEACRALGTAMETVDKLVKSFAEIKDDISNKEVHIHGRRNDLIVVKAELDTAREQVDFLNHQLARLVDQQVN